MPFFKNFCHFSFICFIFIFPKFHITKFNNYFKVFNNNAIQNAQQLSRVDKHNLRKYDDNENEPLVLFRNIPKLL